MTSASRYKKLGAAEFAVLCCAAAANAAGAFAVAVLAGPVISPFVAWGVTLALSLFCAHSLLQLSRHVDWSDWSLTRGRAAAVMRAGEASRAPPAPGDEKTGRSESALQR